MVATEYSDVDSTTGYLGLSLVLVLVFMTSIYHIQLFQISLYDKFMHMSIGTFFAINYFKEMPDDNVWVVATVFSILYEFFVYIVFAIPIYILANPEASIELYNTIALTFVKYVEPDEWADIIATWLGVFLFGIYITNRMKKRIPN